MATATRAQKKLMRELDKMRDLLREVPTCGVGAHPANDNDLTRWEGIIVGPPDSPFEGGYFLLRLYFSDKYPNCPPEVKFVSPIYHPNVYSDGKICLDILKDMWSPALQITTILQSIRSLLCDPNPESPANVDAAKDFRESKQRYAKKVRDQMHQSGLMGQPPMWYHDLCATALMSTNSSNNNNSNSGSSSSANNASSSTTSSSTTAMASTSTVTTRSATNSSRMQE